MIENPRLKVIIDTNLWISFLIGKQLDSLKLLLVNQTVQLIISNELFEELNLVTQRPKLQKYFATKKVAELIKLMNLIGIFIEIKSEVNLCRDAKDNYLLALAKDSQADYLITGDADLLIIKQFEQTKITTYNEFYYLLNS
jgi:putative PIN family toxin of toxin-antitoxin system